MKTLDSSKFKFKSVSELLEYRKNFRERVNELLAEGDSDEIKAMISRCKEYILAIDLLLNDAFFTTMQEKLTGGLNIDPVLFGNINPERLIGSPVKIGLELPPPEDTQQSIEFKEEVKKPEPMPIKELIEAIFKKNGKEVTTVIKAAQVFAGRNGINIEETGIGEVLNKFVREFPEIAGFEKLKKCGKWILDMVQENDNPVVAYITIMRNYWGEDPSQIGELLQWLVNYGFSLNKNEKEKYNDWDIMRFKIALNKPYRIVMSKDDIIVAESGKAREAIDKVDPGSGCYLVYDKLEKSSLMQDQNIAKLLAEYIKTLGDDIKITDYYDVKTIDGVKTKILKPKILHRYIQQACDFGSPVKRETLAERRRKAMEGSLETRSYSEKAY